MLAFFTENAATLIVGLVLLAVVALILRSMIRNKKAGKSSCGCGCSDCPSCSSCHGTEK